MKVHNIGIESDGKKPLRLMLDVRQTATMQLTPGTVSRILWHFTGGPAWNSEKN
jgi:hypothetical protein